jgi:adenylate cyclase
VMQNLVAALFADAAADPRIAPTRSVVEQGIVASMCAPLKAGDRVLGVIYADTLMLGRPPTQDELELLAGFANQAALALDNAMLQERLRAEAVARDKLTRFFPRSVAERILTAEGAHLPVVEARVTALFCDISGYSALTSTLAPREVIDLLNEYFGLVSKPIFDSGGTLEKYIGDALLAIWGAPFSSGDDADRAVTAAAAMMRAVRGRRFEIHIGLHTGVVVAGNIGTEQYLQYAAVGTTTNLASRIAEVAQRGEIVLSAETLAAMRRPPPGLEPLPPTSVKGHEAPLTLLRLHALQDP